MITREHTHDVAFQDHTRHCTPANAGELGHVPLSDDERAGYAGPAASTRWSTASSCSTCSGSHAPTPHPISTVAAAHPVIR